MLPSAPTREQPKKQIYRFVFFFQAEDGIRDLTVTGVQTCALPIFPPAHSVGCPSHCVTERHRRPICRSRRNELISPVRKVGFRSEERRVGKERRSRRSPEHDNKNRSARPTRGRACHAAQRADPGAAEEADLSFRFFFSSRRRHTRFDCDWSSDVCSSDLPTCPLSWMSQPLRN